MNRDLQTWTAIVLAGGRGKRLRPLTDALPKPLVRLAGQPILSYLLDHLERSGIERAVLCTGYRSDRVEEFVRGRETSLSISCSDLGESAAMIDRISAGARQAGDGPLLLCYGDTLANVDLSALAAVHARSDRPVTMTVHPMKSPFGVVELDGRGLVQTIAEKPILPHWINIGFVACERIALEQAARGTDLVQFLGAMAAKGQVAAHIHDGLHLTVNTEDDLAEAEAALGAFERGAQA